VHAWFVGHCVFGPLISDWHRHGAIDRRANTVGFLSMVAVFIISLALGGGTTVLVIQTIALTCAGAFVLSRPEPP